MILCTIPLINTQTYMEAASQWNNMPSNQCLVQKKYQSNRFWTCVLYFAVQCEITHPKVISTRRNIFQTQKHMHTRQKYKKIAEIKNIPYFLPVVYKFTLHIVQNMAEPVESFMVMYVPLTPVIHSVSFYLWVMCPFPPSNGMDASFI